MQQLQPINLLQRLHKMSVGGDFVITPRFPGSLEKCKDANAHMSRWHSRLILQFYESLQVLTGYPEVLRVVAMKLRKNLRQLLNFSKATS